MALQSQAYSFGSTAIAGDAVNTESKVQIRPGWAFVCRYLVEELTPTSAAWNFNIRSPGRQEDLFNQNIRSNLAIGDGLDQAWLFPGFLFLPGEEAVMSMSDTSGSTNTVRPAMLGYEYPANEHGIPILDEDKEMAWDFTRQHVSYANTAQNDSGTTVTANAIDSSVTISVRPRPFHLKSIVFAATSNNMTYNLYSRKRGEYLWRHPVRITGTNGTAEKPVLVEPAWTFPANDDIQFYFEDFSGSGNTVRCVLNGTEEVPVAVHR